MPVSNPSYFPDQRGNGSVIGITAGQFATGANCFLGGTNAGRGATVADLIVIGNNSAESGMTGVDLAGSIVIGVGSAPFVIESAGSGFPLTVVGTNSLSTFNHDNNSEIDSTVVIGSGNVNGVSSTFALTGSVFVGNNLFPNANIVPAFDNTVVIGYNINTRPAGDRSVGISSTLIGSNLFTNSYASEYVSGVFIGSSIDVYQNALANSGNIAIGNGLHVSSGSGNIQMGRLGYINTGGANSGADNVCIGDSATYSGSGNIVIGGSASSTEIAGDGTFGCVVIGNHAGNSIVGSGLTNVFVLESSTAASGGGATPSPLMAGSFKNGNLVIGGADLTVDTALLTNGVATNVVKLVNGTIGAVNPTGGGYFYVSAGALHWVGSAGTDTVVAPA
jgi:hypothetical protein